MSQSPTKTSSSGEILQYDAGWAALNKLLRAGRSFSGRERNCCFLNLGQRRFANVSAATGLDLIDDGRGLAKVDWDLDGDLDFWVTNRTGPRVRFLRNESPRGNHFLAVRLQGTTCNRDAIGARVELFRQADDPQPLIRSLRAGEGYLSQSSKWLHFGLGEGQIDRLVVHWPGGEKQTFSGIDPSRRYLLVQNASQAEMVKTPAPPTGKLRPSLPKTLKQSRTSRVVLLRPAPMPQGLTYIDTAGRTVRLDAKSGKPRLINLWATWCQNCLAELSSWTAHEQQLRDAGIDVLALCVDEPSDDRQADRKKVRRFATKRGLPFTVGFPNEGLVEALEVMQRTFIGRQSPLPLPSSFLLDGQGRLAVIYKGPVHVEQLLRDVKILDTSSESIAAAAVPFPGRWLNDHPPPVSPRKVAVTYVDGGFVAQARSYLKQLIPLYETLADTEEGEEANKAKVELAEIYVFIGAILYDEKKFSEAITSYQSALRYRPELRKAHLEMVNCYTKLDNLPKVAEHLQAALKIRRKDPENLAKLAALKARLGDTSAAIELYEESLKHKSQWKTHFDLAGVLRSQGDARAAARHYRLTLEQRPDSPLAANNLAWVLATHPDNKIRDGREAVRLSESACRITEDRIPHFLGTLAASYAEIGQFDRAVETAQKAIRLALAAEKKELVRSLEAKLDLYKADKPYRDTGT